VPDPAFVRSVGERDRIHVTRSDGSEASWPFPTYGDRLPHDLVHLVVEAAFGLSRGFWGRVDEGADPKRIGDQANRAGGADKYAAYGPDQRELMLAEALANTPWTGDAEDLPAQIAAACEAAAVEPPAGVSPERIRAVKDVLAGLAARWRSLDPKGALHVSFDRGAPWRSFDALSS
jgi:hypothetical protein